MADLNVIIIGAGFAGLATAIELARRGAKVQIFEAYHDVRKQGWHPRSFVATMCDC